MGNNAVFYIAKGMKYIREAEQSADSLRRLMPDIPIFLFSFDGISTVKQTIPLKYDEGINWYENSIRAFGTVLEVLQEYDSLVYLDTDTYVCQPFYEAFALLKRFELIATHAPGRATCGTVMDFDFPADFHVGFLGFRNSSAIVSLFEAWLSFYNEHQAVYGDNDQGPLRDAIWYEGTNTYILPPEYCFRFRFGGFACGLVKVLHGRADNLGAVAWAVNKETKMRTFDKGTLRGL
jgi:hypothetical protein